MKVKFNFEIVEVGDEIIAVPTGDHSDSFHGVIKTNNIGKDILNLLQNDIDEASIICELKKKYTDENNMIPDSVHNTIMKLYVEGIIE